jgi:hypothetical protein
VIPALRPPVYMHSPLVGTPPVERTTLMFFRGSFRNPEETGYSRGIRQKLRKLAHSNQWATNYEILVGTAEEVPGDYSLLLASSKFCLVAPGTFSTSQSILSYLCVCPELGEGGSWDFKCWIPSRDFMDVSGGSHRPLRTSISSSIETVVIP